MQLAQLANRFLMEGLCRGCLVEIQVSSEYLVGSFSRQYHLDAHALDDSCQQVHGGGSAYRGHVVCLCEVDDVPDGIDSLLDGVIDFVMNRTYMLCHATGFLQVGSSLESHGEGVQAWPPCTSLSSVLHALGSIFLCNGTYDAAVQSAAEQYAIGYVTHELLLHGFLKSHPKLVYVGRIVLYGIVFHPVACVPAAHHTLAAVEIMSGQEGLVFVAESLKCLELAGHVGLPVLVMSDIQGDDSYGVACNEVFVALLIVECEGEYAAQALQEVDAMGAIECQYHLTVAACLVFIFAGSLLSDLLVIINLSVDG